jgi:6-phosphogluconate dehydrogenase
LLKEGPYNDINLGKAGDVWQHHSVISSWLNELTAQAVTENPNMTGISGSVAETGETRWALQTADEQGFSLPSIQAAFDVRIQSQNGETNYATKIVAAQRNKFGGHSLNSEGAE